MNLTNTSPKPQQTRLVRTRWNYFRDRLIERFGEVVYKVGVDAGFDCPNRDGTKAYGGCAYCSQLGSLSPNQDPKLGIREQIDKGRAFVERRYGAKKVIVYFQAFTNTYAENDVLRARYEVAMDTPGLVGLSIATRPDCLNASNVEVLKDFASRVPLFTVELGLQSAYQNRLEWVNRQESVDDYIRAMELLNKANLKAVTHVILGFPGESHHEMKSTVRLAEACGTAGVKLQMLHVIRGTKLGVMHSRDPLKLMDFHEYGHLVVDIMEELSPHVEVHRITGETDSDQLLAPAWVSDKAKFFSWFDAELERRNTRQGARWTPPPEPSSFL